MEHAIINHFSDNSYHIVAGTQSVNLQKPEAPFVRPVFDSNKSFNSLMVDIEALSLKKNALVLSIGMIFFNTYNDEEEKHYLMIKPESWSLAAGTPDIDPDTIAFWNRPENVGQLPTPGGSMYCDEAMQFIADACKAHGGPTRFWAKGYDYDYGVLLHWMEEFGIEPPFRYWERRCLRTAIDLAKQRGVDIPRAKVDHNALRDAEIQLHNLRLATKF